jgi:hypothetical protein
VLNHRTRNIKSNFHIELPSLHRSRIGEDVEEITAKRYDNENNTFMKLGRKCRY